MGNSHGKPVVFTDRVNLNHFRLLRVVGKGAFGKVRIVERKDTGCTFALKYIRKDEVVRSESVRNIIRERRMLEHLNHPFLCNLRYSFQDIEYLYLVVDLMTGGDLRFHISRKSFTEDAVRFWIAELGCAIEYIHTQGIVHRDVKPDNILLDQDGHVHLADFNVASDYKPDKPLTSKSGTLAYLAPEVYEGKGYSCEVDWWSLGVTFYECIYNKRPFEAHNHDGLASKIRQAEPPFPLTNPPVSNACLITARGLLSKDSTQRVGTAGFDTFTNSPFFRPINFVALEKKELEPVFRPSSEKTNFDATYDLEELLLEEAPLEARARRQKPREQLKVDATREEIRADELHRMIEKLFEPFDYTLAQYDKSRMSDTADSPLISQTGTITSGADWSGKPHLSNQEASATTPKSGYSETIGTGGPMDPLHIQSKGFQNTYAESLKGSPPLPTIDLHANHPPRSVPGDYFSESLPPPPQPESRPQSRPHSSRSTSKNRKGLLSRKAAQMDDVEGIQDSMPDVPPVQISSEGPDGARGMGLDDREKRPSGMLAFLSRKKGRDRSPKSRERGVLGKEGARVVVAP